MTMSVKTQSRALSSSRIVKGLLDRVKHNDRAGDAAANGAMRFVLGGSGSSPNPTTSVGLVLPQAANEFSRFPSLFSVTDKEVRLLDQSDWLDEETSDNNTTTTTSSSSSLLLLMSKRSEALQNVLQTMREADSIPALRGWRDETFSVRKSFHADPLLYVERAAAVLFGVPAYGVFVNGYCCDANDDKPTHLWIGKRSPTKQTWPSRWDSLAAGGLGAGVLPRQAMLNECIEEAGIDELYLEENLKAVSAVSYTGFNDDGWGLKRDVLFCFDLQVPDDFVPVPVDGEMESFEKMSIDTVLELLAEPIRQKDDSDNLWKPNVGVVLIDFFVRHGILDADDPHFLELIDAVRGAKCA
eukprot:CAMPEP_0197268278 /NCGR_PEP_ID=MMETSP1432-20130617/4081_1 /TAXON_ID=44447 /ORGANISM="Pseudo-nitzschia delicatissima, Strain UNC1205" /LENGTH=354 /DNA_ID=CAMNT_0042733317 /DNA_START=103 /DNA_END=1167 /DNA_ORIENTATION=+